MIRSRSLVVRAGFTERFCERAATGLCLLKFRDFLSDHRSPPGP
jgi:hypothetical protein